MSGSILIVPAGGKSLASTRVRLLGNLPYLDAAGIKWRILNGATHVAGNGYPSAQSGHGRIGRFIVGRTRRTARRPLGWLRALQATVVAPQYDAVFVQKMPFPPLLQELMVHQNPRLIFDFDDALFAATRYYGPESWLVNQLRTSCLVLAGNTYLAEYAERFTRRTKLMPTPVDTDHYIPRAERGAADGPVRIGWIGSPSTRSQLELLRDVILRLGSTCPRVSLCVIGIATSRLEGMPIQYYPWTLETEVPRLQGLDIGIMPLEDTSFTRGKCGYKLLQYMACALPVVASPVGVNQEIVREGINGFLATDDAEWIAKLSLLIEDVQMRQRLGINGRRLVEEEYSYRVLGPQWVSAVQSVVG